MTKRPLLLPSEGREVPVSVLDIVRREETLWVSSTPAPLEAFPPCIRRILGLSIEGRGRHRAAAILAAFLGQVGWSRDEALQLWSGVAGVEDRIFLDWFQRMHCPRCDTMKRRSDGYPDLGMSDLDLCQPDAACREFQGPVEYACRVRSAEDLSAGRVLQIKTLYRARVFDWTSGRECEVELREDERDELLALLESMAGRPDLQLIYTRACLLYT
ncbi:MAG: hypothetical protein QUS08_05330, partial [Methanothrix sp.]|nr:hypothetical protein [Methanothrix sp.]